MTRVFFMLTCILATDLAGGIAKDGDIPWKIPRDLKLFRTMTVDSIVIMGRKTFDSLPPQYRPLPNRLNIVVSHACEKDNIMTRYMNIDEISAYIQHNKQENMWLIGGAQLVAQLDKLGLVDAYLLTIVHNTFDCDTVIDLDAIRFEKTKLIYDSPDETYRDLVYHFEYRSVAGMVSQRVIDQIRLINGV